MLMMLPVVDAKHRKRQSAKHERLQGEEQSWKELVRAQLSALHDASLRLIDTARAYAPPEQQQQIEEDKAIIAASLLHVVGLAMHRESSEPQVQRAIAARRALERVNARKAIPQSLVNDVHRWSRDQQFKRKSDLYAAIAAHFRMDERRARTIIEKKRPTRVRRTFVRAHSTP